MQILKNNIRLQIEQAASMLFSSVGYEKSGIAEIAKQAGISTGNVYRYFGNKQKLLYSIVSDDFVNSCFKILLEKIENVKSLSSDQIAASQEFAKGNLYLLDFLICNRLKLVILMKGCPGTRFEDFNSRIRSAVIKAVSEYFSSVTGKRKKKVVFSKNLLLETLYENLINATLVILASKTSDVECRQTLQMLIEYHLKGMSTFA